VRDDDSLAGSQHFRYVHSFDRGHMQGPGRFFAVHSGRMTPISGASFNEMPRRLQWTTA